MQKRANQSYLFLLLDMLVAGNFFFSPINHTAHPGKKGEPKVQHETQNIRVNSFIQTRQQNKQQYINCYNIQQTQKHHTATKTKRIIVMVYINISTRKSIPAEMSTATKNQSVHPSTIATANQQLPSIEDSILEVAGSDTSSSAVEWAMGFTKLTFLILEMIFLLLFFFFHS